MAPFNFGRFIDKKGPDECWPYKGVLNSAGYGPHRKVYQAVNGAIPAGKIVMHGCNNRSCCNPAHLILGTQTQNLLHAKLCGRRDFAQISLGVRTAKRGTGVQKDRRYASCYNVMFKVLGKPLYLGVYHDERLAHSIAKAAMDEAEKLLRTTQGITYEEIKEHFKCA